MGAWENEVSSDRQDELTWKQGHAYPLLDRSSMISVHI